MKKVKFWTFTVSCLLIMSFLSGCSQNNKNMQTNADANTGGSTTLVKYYNTLSELDKDALEIVEFKVNSQETITYLDIPFTISTGSIIRSFKGELQTGDEIQIIETGGEYIPLDLLGKPLPKATMQLNGIPVLEKSAHEVIFLTEFEGPQVTEQTYIPIGVYQGRFKIDTSGYLIQMAPENEKLKELEKINIESLSEALKKAHSK